MKITTYYQAEINMKISQEEVPDLRESIGWDRRKGDYPILFERCNFWAGVSDEHDRLIAFGYITGMGLQHGYMEDLMVHPLYRQRGIGKKLVAALVLEAESFGIEIVTLTFDPVHTDFYQSCGLEICSGGVWRSIGKNDL